MQKGDIWFEMQSCGDNKVITAYWINYAKDFCVTKSIHGIIFARYGILINYGTVVEIYIIHTNSQFPGFLVYKQDRVIILWYSWLYLAFLYVFLQVLLYFFQLSFAYNLLPGIRWSLCKV